MNKLIYIAASIAVLLALTSCGGKNKEKTREERVEEFRSKLTAADTTAMLQLCDDAMEKLKAGDTEGVLASLYEYTDSTQEVKPLSELTAKKYSRMFKMFPVLSYQRKYFSFQYEGCNDVKYEVTFANADQTANGEPAKTSYMFNPVKSDGEWKLCVKTADDEIDQLKR